MAQLGHVMLPDTPDVETVLFGAHGIAEGVRAAEGSGTRKVIVDLSSISPTATQAASLTIMCGGEAAVFEKILPLLVQPDS